MPLLRYFLLVGGTLLALLVISDTFMPKQPMPVGPAADLSTVRIRSDHKWPARVVFDTSMPALAQMQTAQVAPPPVEIPPAVGASASARQAFAQMPAASGEAKSITAVAASVRSERKPRAGRRMARRNPGPRLVLIAQRPPYGFFW